MKPLIEWLAVLTVCLSPLLLIFSGWELQAIVFKYVMVLMTWKAACVFMLILKQQPK